MVIIETKNIGRNIEKFYKSSEKKTYKLSAFLKATVIGIFDMFKFAYKVKE